MRSKRSLPAPALGLTGSCLARLPLGTLSIACSKDLPTLRQPVGWGVCHGGLTLICSGQSLRRTHTVHFRTSCNDMPSAAHVSATLWACSQIWHGQVHSLVSVQKQCPSELVYLHRAMAERLSQNWSQAWAAGGSHVGLSVSRIGPAAQLKAVKQVAGTSQVEVAQAGAADLQGRPWRKLPGAAAAAPGPRHCRFDAGLGGPFLGPLETPACHQASPWGVLLQDWHLENGFRVQVN